MKAVGRLLPALVAAAVLACGGPSQAPQESAATRTAGPPPVAEAGGPEEPEEARAKADDESAPRPERARAHSLLGRELSRQGRLRDAAARLESAAELFAGDPAELAPTLNDLSDVLFRLGDFEGQEEVLWRALDEAVAVGDRRTAAISWNNLGVSFAARGRPSAALAAYQRCLELRRDLGDRSEMAVTRHNLGVQQLLLGRVDEGVEELRQAVATRRWLEDPTAVGQTLASLAWGLALDGQNGAALDAYAEAVALLEAAGAVHDLAIALEQRAQLYRALGRPAAARADLQKSLDLLAAVGAPPLHAAYLRLGLGAVEREQTAPGDADRLADAVALLREAVATFDGLGAQEGRVLARLELARALRRQEDGRDAAISELEAALDVVEAARSELRLPSFRATFLGGWQAVYQELADLLASAAADASERALPAQAHALAERALAVAERARARSLLDRMAADIAVDSQPGSEPWHDLRARVEALESRALLEPSREGDPADGARGAGPTAGEARAALREARFALERLQEVSQRDAPPSPAATPADVDVIRRHLDADTVLLIYSLAPHRSWLWRVDRQGVTVFPLPPGAEIETAARHAHQLLPLHHRLGYGKAAGEALARLARQVLGPLEGDLGAGRLAVVPDGALHLVPFGALPLPSGDPLAAAYEVVHLPSASTLVALRRRASRPPPPHLLAVVVDPVFEAGDPRLGGPRQAGAAGDLASPALARTRRALDGRLGRLPATAEEGARIAEVARRSAGVEPPIHRGFDARRELVTGGALSDFRILHFATHGVADAEDPSLAGLVLSLYDASGRSQDGLLRARDLHGLRLSADLVVLSACRTALGQEVRGEGLVGLADGFFAAGANHLVVSLWDVDDRATAELMVRFYRHLLLGGRRPADALRRAQMELRDETEWRSPAYWAAFVAVGDPSVPSLATLAADPATRG